MTLLGYRKNGLNFLFYDKAKEKGVFWNIKECKIMKNFALSETSEEIAERYDEPFCENY